MAEKDRAELARRLRRDSTPAEKILWSIVRNRAFGGLRFRRQQEIGPYFVDFYCSALRLVVELDGDSHVGQETEDGKRQRWLEAQGILVVRFLNHELYDHAQEVL